MQNRANIRPEGRWKRCLYPEVKSKGRVEVGKVTNDPFSFPLFFLGQSMLDQIPPAIILQNDSLQIDLSCSSILLILLAHSASFTSRKWRSAIS